MSISELVDKTLNNPYQKKLYKNSLKRLEKDKSEFLGSGKANLLMAKIINRLSYVKELNMRYDELAEIIEKSIPDGSPTEIISYFNLYFKKDVFEVHSKKDLEFFDVSVVWERLQYIINKEEKYCRLLVNLLNTEMPKASEVDSDLFGQYVGLMFDNLTSKNENHFFDALFFDSLSLYCVKYSFEFFKKDVPIESVAGIYRISTDRELNLMRSGEAAEFLFQFDIEYRKTLIETWFVSKPLLNPVHLFIKIEIVKAIFKSKSLEAWDHAIVNDIHPYVRSRYYILCSKYISEINKSRVIENIENEKSMPVLLNAYEFLYESIDKYGISKNIFNKFFDKVSTDSESALRKLSYEFSLKYVQSLSYMSENYISTKNKVLAAVGQESDPKVLFFAFNHINKFYVQNKKISEVIEYYKKKGIAFNSPQSYKHKGDLKNHYKAFMVAASESWPLYANFGRYKVKMRRGYWFTTKFWRLIYELTHSRPDKRQAFNHTVSRRFDFSIKFATGLLAEVSQTMVPGEPLVMVEEGSYRDFLPLVDDVLIGWKELFFPLRRRIVSSYGLTKIDFPKSFLKRFKASFILSFKFADFAAKRNIVLKDGLGQGPYIKALHDLGYKVRFIPRYSVLSKRSESVYGPQQFFI